MNNYYFTADKWYGPLPFIKLPIEEILNFPSGPSLIPEFAGMVKELNIDFKLINVSKGLSVNITAVPIAEEKEFPDTYPDLSGVPNDKKDEIINTLVEVTAKNVLATFLALGLKEHITANVVNDATGELYKFSFTKVVAEEGKQTFSEEQSELEYLRRWKKEAMYVMPDFQAIGKEIGAGLGESVHDKILPFIIKLKKENEKLKTEYLKTKQ